MAKKKILKYYFHTKKRIEVTVKQAELNHHETFLENNNFVQPTRAEQLNLCKNNNCINLLKHNTLCLCPTQAAGVCASCIPLPLLLSKKKPAEPNGVGHGGTGPSSHKNHTMLALSWLCLLLTNDYTHTPLCSLFSLQLGQLQKHTKNN